MSLFWLGMLVGLVIGEFTGIIIMTLLAANKRR